MVEFTIWDWLNTAGRASEARAKLEEARQAYAQASDLVELDVTESYLRLMEERDKLKVAKRAEEQAQENYRITQSKFRENLVSNTELLDAEVALLQAKLNETHAMIDHNIALASLKKSVGDRHE